MKRIAVIGTGVSGSVVARLLAGQHEVTVYEASSYCGGHANTVDVALQGTNYPVDTGFMVYNQRTYPNFCRLLEELGVASRPSDMSFSVHSPQHRLEYQGSSLNGIFAQRSNLLSPHFLRMLRDITRFNRVGTEAVVADDLEPGLTVGTFLNQHGLGEQFQRFYLAPMAAAIWSSSPGAILDFPARFMLGFFHNHGLMQLRNRPVWRTIIGGSRQYLQKLLQPLSDRIHLNTPIAAVTRQENSVRVQTAAGVTDEFDEVVFASHSNQALQMLTDATPQEQEILGQFPYQPNRAILHTDTSTLPQRQRAWASWNYRVTGDMADPASVTYDLSRLQGHASPTPILLTLNPHDDIRADTIVREFIYDHPIFHQATSRLQARWKEISGTHRTHYCGAYWGYGFHEDGVNSAFAVAKTFGVPLDLCEVASTKERLATAGTPL